MMHALTVTTHSLVADPKPDVAYDAEHSRLDTDPTPSTNPVRSVGISDPKAVIWIGSATRVGWPGSATVVAGDHSIVHRRSKRYIADGAVELPENDATTARLGENAWFHLKAAQGGWMPSLAATVEYRMNVRDPAFYVTNTARDSACVVVEIREQAGVVDNRPLRPGEARAIPQGTSQLVLRSCRHEDACRGRDHRGRSSAELAMGWAYMLTLTCRPSLVDLTGVRQWQGPTESGTPDVAVIEGDPWVIDVGSFDKAKAIVVRYGVQMLARTVRSHSDAEFAPISQADAHKLATALGWADAHALRHPRVLNATSEGVARDAIQACEITGLTPAEPGATSLLYRLGVLRPHPVYQQTLRVRMSSQIGEQIKEAKRKDAFADADRAYEESRRVEGLASEDAPEDTDESILPEGTLMDDDQAGDPRYWCVQIPVDVINMAVAMDAKKNG